MTDQPVTEGQRTALSLDAAEVVALVERAGVQVDSLSPLAPLLTAAHDGERPDVGDHGPEVDAAIATLAAPHRQLRVLAPMPSEALAAYYYSGNGVEGFVGASVFGDGVEITSPWAPGDLTALSGATLLTDGVPAPADLSITLSLAGVTALVGAVDALNHAHLEGALARRPDPLGTIDRAAIQAQLEVGTTMDDARWAVSLMNLLAPPVARLDPEALDAGLDELEALGLLTSVGDGWEADIRLFTLAAHWRPVLPALSHEVIGRGSDDITYRYQITVRGDGPLYALDYVVDEDGTPLVHLHGVAGLAWLQGLTRLLGGTA